MKIKVGDYVVTTEYDCTTEGRVLKITNIVGSIVRVRSTSNTPSFYSYYHIKDLKKIKNTKLLESLYD